MNEILVIDQNITGILIEANSKTYQFAKAIHELIDKGEVPSIVDVSHAGLIEFLGMRFYPENALKGLSRNPPPNIEDVAKHFQKSIESFSAHIDTNKEYFGINQLIEKITTRFNEMKKYKGNRPFFDFIGQQDIIPKNYDTILAYWTIKLMQSDLFDSDYVGSERASFYGQTLQFAIPKHIPISRVVNRLVTFNGEPVKQLREGEEYLDEDLIWQLVFGYPTNNGISKLHCLSCEDFMPKVKVLAGAIQALKQRDPEVWRLMEVKFCPGEFRLIKHDKFVVKEIIATMVESLL